MAVVNDSQMCRSFFEGGELKFCLRLLKKCKNRFFIGKRIYVRVLEHCLRRGEMHLDKRLDADTILFNSAADDALVVFDGETFFSLSSNCRGQQNYSVLVNRP